MRLLPRFAAVILASGLVLALTVTALAVPASMVSEVGSGEPAAIELGALAQRSYVYAADGSVLASLRGKENREPVALADVPDHVVTAILAVEDSGFWIHDGFDVRGMLRAFMANVDAGGISQGGSTITQQLVKLDLLTSEKTIDRKVQELVLAARLEKQMSKEEILNRYLNTVYFGSGAYGVQAAAETYFGVNVSELDPGQAALLAGIIRNPGPYNPVRNPERAERRRSVALGRMVEEGVISEDERIFWDASPLPEKIHEVLPPPNDYFVEEVKARLLRDERLGKTYEDRKKAVFQGGLKIHTTYDPAAQQAALSARDQNLPLDNGRVLVGTDANGDPQFASAAVASIDPATGAVRAMVGGPGFDKHKYNLVTQSRRNPGSAFKTFVLAELMEQGKSPQDTVNGIGPCIFAMPDGQDPYIPSNFEGSRGSVDTVERQTLRSSNCAYVRLGLIAGHKNVIDMAHRLGVSDGADMPVVMSMPLGTASITPLDMASSYATLANDGVYNEPYYIQRVDDRHDKIIFEHTPEPKKVIEPQTARLVTDILEKNIQSGTGTAARIRTGHPAAGKTGTHQGHMDAWFVGYSRQMATAVWVGGLGSQFPVRIEGRQISGGNFPARIWGDYMTAWHEGKPVEAFPEPAPVPPSGELKAPPEIDLVPSPPPPKPPKPPKPSAPPPRNEAPPEPAPEQAPPRPGPPPDRPSPPAPPPDQPSSPDDD